MVILVDVQPALLGDKQTAYLVKALVEAQGFANATLIKKLRLPTLYRSNVRFRNEPWAGKFESVASAPIVYMRGWGDCAHLSAYRIGELRLAGQYAGCKVYWRPESRLFHVEVRLCDGTAEDPSRMLGM